MAIEIASGNTNNNGLFFPGRTPVAVGGAMTMAAWIRPYSLGGGSLGRIFSAESTTGWSFALTNGSGFQFQLTFAGTPSQAFICASNTNVLQIGTTVPWQHVAATWDGTANAPSACQLFLNGSLVPIGFSQSGIGTMTNYTGRNLTVGNRGAASPLRAFHGQIAECGLWAGILPFADIRSLAQGISVRRVSPRYARWTLPLVRELMSYQYNDLPTSSPGVTIAQHPRSFA